MVAASPLASPRRALPPCPASPPPLTPRHEQYPMTSQHSQLQTRTALAHGMGSTESYEVSQRAPGAEQYTAEQHRAYEQFQAQQQRAWEVAKWQRQQQEVQRYQQQQRAWLQATVLLSANKTENAFEWRPLGGLSFVRAAVSPHSSPAKGLRVAAATPAGAPPKPKKKGGLTQKQRKKAAKAKAQQEAASLLLADMLEPIAEHNVWAYGARGHKHTDFAVSVR